VIRHVDANRRRGRLYGTYTRAVASRPGMWFTRTFVWRLDPILMRLTGGTIGMAPMIPTALLETTGTRSGRMRRNVVIYFHDGDDPIVVASKVGDPQHPAWFHNARAHPDVRLGGEDRTAVVVADDGERERLYGLAENVFPPFAGYQRRAGAAGRTIPVLRLTSRVGP